MVSIFVPKIAPKMNGLSDINVIAMILSYIELGDVAACRLVCSQWYKASQRRHFWTRHIAQRLANVKISLHCKHAFARQALDRFDTFSHPEHTETLREQVEWVFQRKWFAYGEAGSDRSGYENVHVTRYTHNFAALSNVFDATLKLVGIRQFRVNRIGQTNPDSWIRFWYPTRVHGLLYRSCSGKIAKGSLVSVIYRYPDGKTVKKDLIAIASNIDDWIDTFMADQTPDCIL